MFNNFSQATAPFYYCSCGVYFVTCQVNIGTGCAASNGQCNMHIFRLTLFLLMAHWCQNSLPCCRLQGRLKDRSCRYSCKWSLVQNDVCLHHLPVCAHCCLDAVLNSHLQQPRENYILTMFEMLHCTCCLCIHWLGRHLHSSCVQNSTLHGCNQHMDKNETIWRWNVQCLCQVDVVLALA